MDPVVVVPCFNEAERLEGERFFELLDAGASVVFVDDGSRDGTRSLLDALAAKNPKRVRVLPLEKNVGKGEAVRAGLTHALAGDGRVTRVAYLDADLSTPPGEMLRVLAALDDAAVDVALGSRVRTLGRHIDRKPMRHYLGRAFATAASLTLGAGVYDTQCGAKAFRRTPSLEAALREPFTARWVFDVELLARLLERTPIERFREVPLEEWHHKDGGSLTAPAMLRAGVDLGRIAFAHRRRRLPR